MFVGGVRLGVWDIVLVMCVCVPVSGVLFSVDVCVRDLLIFLTFTRARAARWTPRSSSLHHHLNAKPLSFVKASPSIWYPAPCYLLLARQIKSSNPMGDARASGSLRAVWVVDTQ